MIRGAVAIFNRDFKKFLSNPFVVIMTLMMPIMYLVIFGNAMGGDHQPHSCGCCAGRSALHPDTPVHRHELRAQPYHPERRPEAHRCP